MTPNESESHPPLSPEAKNHSTRRDFLLQIGVVINAIAAFMIGIPIIGFIFSSLIKNTPPVWFSLGPTSNFPEGAMRRAVFENPYRREADGQTSRLTCWVSRIQGDQFKVFAANCTHLGCPGPLVRRIAAFHVSVSRRSFLRGRWVRCGPSSEGLICL